MEAKHWRYYYEKMLKEAPLVIYYPTCGGGEECLYVCPNKDRVWEMVPMKVTLFGFKEEVRMRPFMAHPENCARCFLCMEACPTGALKPSSDPPKHPYLDLFVNTIKLFFKKRYGWRWVLRKEHIEKFKKNNNLT
ncbi:(4Fe-4S)-binding protein [Ignicoccus pacificus DSM 13166]|uniref:(4Fe-4S)-binding protein n=1 Tax=Ignicoccus pacificus DSM 13166 TaxID=940294 RepID=A0A977KBG1_9CREN|nr:(4Fe-4S)-binding protein [Ignicoccus pacificus DSM 13166]